MFLGNIADDFRPGETTDRHRFVEALKRFERLSYLSFAAMLGDGWTVD